MLPRPGRGWCLVVSAGVAVVLGAAGFLWRAPRAGDEADSSPPAARVGPQSAKGSARTGGSAWFGPAMAGGVDTSDSRRGTVSPERQAAAGASGQVVRRDPQTGSEVHLSYDADGRLREQVEYGRDREIRRRVQRVTSEDREGIEESRYGSDGDLTMRCDYDEDGLLRGRRRYDSGRLLESSDYDDSGRLSARVEYDENGEVVAEGRVDAEGRFRVRQGLAGAAGRARLESVYDEGNRLLEEWEIDEQGVAHGRRYDPQDYATLEKWAPSFDGLFADPVESGAGAEEEVVDAEGVLSRKRTYDREGLLRQEVAFHPEDNTWIATNYRFSAGSRQPGSLEVFDEQGKLLRYVRYDAEGFALTELVHDEGEGTWVANDYSRDPRINHPQTVRTYDSSGVLSREESYDFSFGMRSLRNGESAGEWLEEELHVSRGQADPETESVPWHMQTFASTLGVTGLRYDEESGETVVDLDLNDERLGHTHGEIFVDLEAENVRSDLVGRTVGVTLTVPAEFVGGWIHLFAKEGDDWKTEYGAAHFVTEAGLQQVEHTFEKAFSGNSRVLGINWHKSGGYRGEVAIQGIDWGETGGGEDLDGEARAGRGGSAGAVGSLAASGYGVSGPRTGDKRVASNLASAGQAGAPAPQYAGPSTRPFAAATGPARAGGPAQGKGNAPVGYAGEAGGRSRPARGTGEGVERLDSGGGEGAPAALAVRGTGPGQAGTDNAPGGSLAVEFPGGAGSAVSDARAGDRDPAPAEAGRSWPAAPVSAVGMCLLLGLLALGIRRLRTQEGAAVPAARCRVAGQLRGAGARVAAATVAGERFPPARPSNRRYAVGPGDFTLPGPSQRTTPARKRERTAAGERVREKPAESHEGGASRPLDPDGTLRGPRR